MGILEDDSLGFQLLGLLTAFFFFQGRTVGFSEVHRGVIKLWSHFLGEIKLLLQIYAGNFEEFP